MKTFRAGQLALFFYGEMETHPIIIGDKHKDEVGDTDQFKPGKFRIFRKPEDYNNPLFSRFSISSEILIDFGLTFFMVLTFPADTR